LQVAVEAVVLALLHQVVVAQVALTLAVHFRLQSIIMQLLLEQAEQLALVGTTQLLIQQQL
jgi:hypothetical protein